MTKRKEYIIAAFVILCGMTTGLVVGMVADKADTTGVHIKFCAPIVGKFITPRVC